MSRKSEAVHLANISNLLLEVKKLTHQAAPQTIPTTNLAKKYHLRPEVFKALIELGYLSTHLGPTGKSYQYRWEKNGIHQNLLKPELRAIHHKMKEIIKSYPSYSKISPRKGKLIEVVPVLKKHSTTPRARKDRMLVLKNDSTLFNIGHLEILKRWPLVKPTDIQIISTDEFLFENVTDLEFKIDGSALILEIISRNIEGNIASMSKITFRNVYLKISNKGIDGTKTAALYIEIIRNEK